MPSRKLRPTYIALLAAALSLAAQAEVQLLPAGEFAARDGRPGLGKTWKLSDTQGRVVAAQLAALAARSKFVFDYDHQTIRAEQNGQPAPAAGWATRFEWRDGEGLFATDTRWTAAASAAIEAGEFLYVSPVITFDDAGFVTGVLMAAITNYPALTGMEPIGRDLAAHLSAQFSTPQQPPESEVTLLAALIAAFGLKADANETEALNAVTALKAEAGALTDKAGQPTALSGALVTALGLKPGADEAAALQAVITLKGGDAAALSAITALQAQVAALSAQHTGNQVEALVAQGLTDGRLLPALKDWATQLGKKDLTALQGFLATAPKLLPGAGGQTNGFEPGADGVVALTAETKKTLTLMGVTEEAWLKQYGKKA